MKFDEKLLDSASVSEGESRDTAENEEPRPSQGHLDGRDNITHSLAPSIISSFTISFPIYS